MRISASLKPVVAHSIDWGGWNIGNVRTLVLYNFGNENFEQLLVVLAELVFAPAPVIDTLQNLIVARPQCEGWIIAGPPNLLLDLFFNVDQKLFS